MANFLDTFTGTGDLSTHTPDSGGTWGIFTVNSDGTLADLVLTGTGSLTSSTTASRWFGPTSFTPDDPDNWHIETTVIFTGGVLGTLSLYMKEAGDALFYGPSATLGVYNGTVVQWDFSTDDQGFTGYSSDYGSVNSPPADVEVTIRIEFINGNQVQFSLNGVVRYDSLVAVGPLVYPPLTRAFIRFNGITSSGIRLSSYTANEPVPPLAISPGPGAISVTGTLISPFRPLPSLADLQARLSGGGWNQNHDLSLGGGLSYVSVIGQTPVYTATISGVTVLYMASMNLGTAHIRFNPSTKSLSLKGAGDSAYGIEKVVSATAEYYLEAISKGHAVVHAILDSLPVVETIADFTIVDVRSNLFDRVLASEALTGSVEYRCLYLCNSHPTDPLIGVKLFVISQPLLGTIEFGLDPAGVGDGMVTGVAQSVEGELTAPVGVTFAAPTTSATALSIGDLAVGKVIALWVRRTISPNSPMNNVVYKLNLMLTIG